MCVLVSIKWCVSSPLRQQHETQQHFLKCWSIEPHYIEIDFWLIDSTHGNNFLSHNGICFESNGSTDRNEQPLPSQTQQGANIIILKRFHDQNVGVKSEFLNPLPLRLEIVIIHWGLQKAAEKSRDRPEFWIGLVRVSLRSERVVEAWGRPCRGSRRSKKEKDSASRCGLEDLKACRHIGSRSRPKFLWSFFGFW